MNLINYLNVALDPSPQYKSGPPTTMVILGLLALIVALILITLIVIAIVKDKKKNSQQQYAIDTTKEETTESKRDDIKLTKKLIKKPSMIDDPANVRMAIEESKADLSEFNVKQEEILTEESVTNIDPTAKKENNNSKIVEELDDSEDEEKKDIVDNEII